MAELSVAHRAVLAQMLERVPDKTLKTLSAAVTQMPGDKARALGLMLAEETTDRRRRAVAFAPILPMFRPRPDGVPALVFPSAVLPRLWKAASSREPQLLPLLDDHRPGDDDPRPMAVANRICIAAAAAVRDQPEVVWPPAGFDADQRDQGLEELALCFDLATLARRALVALPAWISRPTEDQLAELRLLIRDSAEVTRDGGPRMVEILFAHLGDAALILRLVANSSKASTKEGLLSECEMAGFVNRLIGEVEARVLRIAAFKPGSTAVTGAGLKADIDWCADTLAELDITLKLDPEGAWGKQAREARERINRTLSATLKSVDRALDKLMPTRKAQTAGRMTRQVPDLDVVVSGEVVQGAVILLTLVGAIRSAAQIFGCESLRYQLVQSVIERITAYVDQVIEAVNAGEANDERRALALVEVLAKCLLLIEAQEPARTARRRAAAAGARPTTDAASERSPWAA